MYTAITRLKYLFPQDCHERVFLVGGTVRDRLLGKPGKDVDLAAAISGEEFAALGFRLVEGKSTVPIWFRHDQSIGTIEVIQLDSAGALKEDLVRRDFSINAMAISLAGELTDLQGGRGDLEAGILRACSRMTFQDDPLRIFRAFRFEADGWRMSAETEALIWERDWSSTFLNIPVERYSREMLKAFVTRHPERFFQRMLEFKIGFEYLPELFSMPRIPAGPLQHHPEGDLFSHSMEVLQKSAAQDEDPMARFCSCFHDLGKLFTDPAAYPKHHGHDQAGFRPALSFCGRLRLPAAYGTALAWVSRLHTTMNLWGQLRDSTRLRLAEQAVKAGISQILPLVSASDKALAFNRQEWEKAVQVVRLSTSGLGIDPVRLEKVPLSKRKDYILQKRVDMLRYFIPPSSS